jgi:hypothetical protein
MPMFRRTRSLVAVTSWALLVGATGSLPAPGLAAKPPKFVVSVSASDVQDWTAANTGTPCTHYGSGRQTVRFASKRSVLVSISERGSGRNVGLFFTGPGAVRYTLTMDAKGTVTREENTVYTPADPADSSRPCVPAAKDCGVRALENQHNFEGEFGDGLAKFQLNLGPGGTRRSLTLQSLYWESEESAFKNCAALKTPEGCCADSPAFWHGPMFGDRLYDAGDAPTTAPVHPLALRRGHTYRFRAAKRYSLRVDPDVPFNSRLGHGRFSMMSTGTGGLGQDDLGSPRSVTHTIAWVVTLRRVA